MPFTETNSNGGASATSAERGGPQIHLGRLDDINTYEVTEHELSVLSGNQMNSVLEGLWTTCLSTGITAIFVILTVDFPENSRKYLWFLVVGIVGTIAGLLMLIIWLVGRTDVKSVVKKIKERKPRLPQIPDRTPGSPESTG